MTIAPASHAQPLHYLQSRKNIPALGLIALRVAVTITLWDQRVRTRRSLNRMTNSDLKDIGITRGEALTEARRPFWKE
ncbi:DUF1127 domain-containing protein [Falsihalocynthiibacter sp. S25ZX9]|uniref:DUF1127 domain-containing protein n=1 Tax=Falsihalocynthiibacter sp. S25ZX9 TaxID=3240870 RepID=UPI00350E9D4C